MQADHPVEVRLERRLPLSCERVFDAWLVPRVLGQWMFGPRVRDENVVRLQVDPRVGGRFSLQVERGGELVDHVGRYLRIDRPRHLSFTWAVKGFSEDAPSEVAIDLVPVGGGCKLTLVHTLDARWAEYAPRTEAGWDTMLQALAELP